VGAWTERAGRSLARGARAALALIVFVVAAPGQAPTSRELLTELGGYFDQGRHEEVVARWQAVESLVDRSKSSWPYVALLAGESMLRLGRWQDCHKLLDCVQTERPKASADLECQCLAMRGRLHLNEGRYDLARAPISRALELANEVRAMEAWAWPTVHYAHLRSVELALALEQHDEVDRLVESYLADEELYANAPLMRGALLLTLGTAQEQREIDEPRAQPRAHATLLSARDGLRQVEASVERDRLLCQIELAMARIELAAGDLESSGIRLAAAVQLAEADQGGALNERSLLATFEAQHALARGANHDVLERIRGDLLSAYEGRFARLASLPPRQGGLGFLHYVEIKAPLVQLARLDVAIDGKEVGGERALTRMLELQALGTLARSMKASTPTVAEVQQSLLAEDGGLLVYLPSARSSVVLLVDRDHVECEETAGLNLMQRALSDYRKVLLAGLSADPSARAGELASERESAAKLARLLFPQSVVERLKTWRTLTVSGLDVLGPVPLGWLPLGDSPHLGRVLAWDTLPSIPFGVAQARALEVPTTPHAELLLVGGVRPSAAVLSEDAGLGTLPLSERTESALTRAYSDHRTLTGDQATVSRVLEESPRHAVVQMLVHAIQDPSRTPPMGLVLESDGEDSGVLWADAVQAGQFAGSATRLAVLAACRSAQGPLRRGDAGSADLAGAWLAAGVPAVLVSHSDLTWGPMVELSEALHAHLRDEGCSPAEALRRSLSERALEDERELPFRYGLLEVVGLGQRPIFMQSARQDEGSQSNALGFALCGVVVIAVSLAARRIRRAA
jgi:CHAT domain